MRHDHPERHDQREERQLAADHRATASASGRPVTAASAMSGVPSAPKATGAVLPISARPAACSGRKPRPISIAAEIATGVPKPAAPFDERAEAEGDQQRLDAAVVGQAGDRCFEDLELPGLRR